MPAVPNSFFLLTDSALETSTLHRSKVTIPVTEPGREEAVVLSKDKEVLVCWHPEPTIPYDCTRVRDYKNCNICSIATKLNLTVHAISVLTRDVLIPKFQLIQILNFLLIPIIQFS